MRLFTLFTYLKTKESYNRWITRRVWGFRQQISKAKYLKMLVGNIRKLQENTVTLYTERKTLRVGAIKGSRYVWPEKLKRPPFPSGCEISGYKMSAHGIPDMKYPEKVKSRPDRILPRVEWAMLRKGDRPRVQGVGTTLPDDTECAWLSGSTSSGFPHGEAPSTREHHTRTIAYPIRIGCPDHLLKWASLATSFGQPATDHVPPPSCPDALSVHLLLLAFQIFLWQRTSKLWFFMFLSFSLLCHGFQRTLLNLGLLWWSKSYQNTKT